MNRARILLIASGGGVLAAGIAVAVVLVASKSPTPAGEAAREPSWKRGPAASANKPRPCEGATCDSRCATEDLFACHWVAQRAVLGPTVAPDVVARLEKNCASGFGASCYTLGDLYAYGKGTAKSDARADEAYARAVSLLTKACDGGGSFDCTVLALMHAHGKGVPKSDERAKEVEDRAASLDRELCDSGRADACIDVANGYGFPHRPPPAEERARLFARACELGDKPACARQKSAETEARYPSTPASALNREFRLSAPPSPARRIGAILRGPDGRDALELIGVEVTEQGDLGKAGRIDRVENGRPFVVRTYLRVIAPLRDDWQIAIHVDGQRVRQNGDHAPMGGAYPTSTWKEGELLVDNYEMRMDGKPPGVYTVYVTLFRGEHRLAVSGVDAAGDRVAAGKLVVE